MIVKILTDRLIYEKGSWNAHLSGAAAFLSMHQTPVATENVRSLTITIFNQMVIQSSTLSF
jgi:hypothetical protein